MWALPKRAAGRPLWSVLGGPTRSSLSPRLAITAASFLLLAVLAGCGEESGVADGATVTAYVAAPLCGEAKLELEREGARAGEVRVRLFCLETTGGAGGVDLATVGENARRASEDSTAVGYLEAPGRAARFATPILETAGIAGGLAMRDRNKTRNPLKKMSAPSMPKGMTKGVSKSIKRWT